MALPYGVICNDNRHGSGRVTNIDITPDDIEQKNGKVVVYYFDFDECGELENCKPYLRPMSSMTEEEKVQLSQYACIGEDMNGEFIDEVQRKDCAAYIDWLNKNHFDYRGLIEKGLALEAPEGMYNLKECII